jgi:hypothetical protein
MVCQGWRPNQGLRPCLRSAEVCIQEFSDFSVGISLRVTGPPDDLSPCHSDKATVEISSRYDGEVVKVYTPVGGMANVGKPLIDIRKPASAASAPSTSADAASASSLSAPQPAIQTAPAHKMSSQEGTMVAPADALQVA